jgi:NAD(P)-dependent dehydrogenase (short-subunit alcohol dehydrogenase family)
MTGINGVLVVSGVGPGLGRAIALRGAAAGADVVLAARTKAILEEVAEGVEALGRRALAVPTDVTSQEQVVDLVEAAVGEFGRVDALVNNAFAMPPMRDLSKVDLEALRESLDVTVLGSLRLTRLFAPHLASAKGNVVMINSAVLRHSRRTFGAYKMAKAALHAVASSLATELGPQGIRVNSVAPSYIWADSTKAYFAYQAAKRGVEPRQIYDEAAATTDLKRLATPEEVADAVIFLASDGARAITGQCLDVNCGEFHT